ncbi:cytochrome c biogenesis protein CcdA [Desulfocurvibacter africanus]|uniref:protein-disulfide reductase DsbD family protein n=1 Tax=Desulfocurvibacter africanus TaxID=873 RepID=UPI002FD8A07C
MMRTVFTLLLTILLWPVSSVQAQLQMPEPPLNISVDFARLPDSKDNAETTTGAVLAAVTIIPEKGWYTYSNQPGSLGQPTVLTASLAGSPEPLEVRYPPGVRKPDPFSPEEMVNLYLGEVTFFVSLPPDVALPADLRLHLSLLLCSEKSCMPVSLERTASLRQAEALPAAEKQPWWPEYGASAPGPQPDQVEPRHAAGPETTTGPETTKDAPEEEWSLNPRYYQSELEVGSIWKAIMLALLAGFLLNFMPCVLPVVSLKISSLVSGCVRGAQCSERAQRQAFTEHNLFFAAGILAYFLVLSLVLSLLGLAWGELFQSPKLIMILSAAVFALALSLFDVYTLPIINLRSGMIDSGNPRASAFSTGVLATLLATPCSGPFLGGVLAWALVQPSMVVAIVFISIGIGMALPYLLMSAWPGLVRFFPKPGAWTVKLERIVGFFLLATCIYLINILPQDYLLSALVLLWITGVSFWIWGAWTDLNQSTRKRWTIRSAALSLVVAAAAWAVQPPEISVHWRDFSAEDFRGRLGQERLLVDFTADWCVSCKFLEQTTLTDKNLADWGKRYGLTYIRVDMTEQNPQGMSLLRELGSQSIPVVAVFPQGSDANRPLVLRDLFTSANMEEALDQLF